ncbi:MAG: Gfo/Idh/MocA family protein, partial [Longimicrobiales bacterium]
MCGHVHVNGERLGIGIIGSGFNAGFHLRGMVGVRDADIRGIWSPTAANAEAAAGLARELGVGEARAHDSITALVRDPAVDAIWLCGPNHTRVENVEEIVHAVESGAGALRAIACEKPLARNLAEAERVLELVTRAGLAHGYLENQVFSPDVVRGRELLWARGARLTGRPYLARAAEEHAGPHAPWFWSGALQGGGVLNDMMCHSALLVWHLLTEPGQPLSSLRPVKIAGRIASLKWTQPAYADRLAETMGADYATSPSEDFAALSIEFETAAGRRVLGEATTSWSYIGAGLRLSAEVLGPEYSMSWNTLDTSLRLFFSREVTGEAGEDLVEKQNAESGLMPVVADEAAAYGYTGENRHFARAFLHGERPLLTFEEGLEVVRLLMSGYRSAEEE